MGKIIYNGETYSGLSVSSSSNISEDIIYDNSTSGLSATNVQGAIDEVTSNYLPLTGGTVSGDISVDKSANGADTSRFVLKNSLREARLFISSSGDIGLYDATNNKYLFTAPASSQQLNISIPIQMNSGVSLTVGNSIFKQGSIELYSTSSPFIDFHYGGSTSDYTSRIIESSSGTIGVVGNFQVESGKQFWTKGNTYLGCSGIPSSESENGNSNITGYAVYLSKVACATNTGYFRPVTDAQPELGTGSYRWKKIFASSTTIETSDEREKDDILSIKDYPVMYSREGEGNVFEQLFNKLEAKTYTLNIEEDKKMHIGFIAQDIVASAEELGIPESELALIDHTYWTDEKTGEERDRYGLGYGEFIALNTHMIQKANKKIEFLESENDALRTELESIKEKLAM